jgi:hypothetical protein
MMKGNSKNTAGGTFSSEERNNSDDLDELPSDAASEGNDESYKASGVSTIQNFY